LEKEIPIQQKARQKKEDYRKKDGHVEDVRFEKEKSFLKEKKGSPVERQPKKGGGRPA